MKEEINPIYEQVGERLRAYRNRSEMTLRELSDATGLSSSYLSKLESGKVGVSVANLDRISQAVGLNIGLLLSDRSWKDRSSWVTKARFRTRIVVEGTVMYEPLVPPIPDFGLTSNLVTCQPGDSSGGLTSHRGHEFRYVVKGELRYWVSDHEFLLEAGDTISHTGSTPHAWENAGSEEAIFLIVGTLLASPVNSSHPPNPLTQVPQK